jgi:hypothetical protein
MKSMREKVLELAAIAKECPENLQAICFETLLKHELEQLSPRKPAREDKPPADTGPANEADKKPSVEDSAKSQDDIVEKDLHTKVRHFAKKYSVTMEDLNNIFYKEAGAIQPLYEDLKTTRMSEGQVRIALLQALRNAISTGDFAAQVADVRAECNVRKCYDQANFASNFSKAAASFDFEKYDKSITTVRLSEDGRKQLAELIKQLK